MTTKTNGRSCQHLLAPRIKLPHSSLHSYNLKLSMAACLLRSHLDLSKYSGFYFIFLNCLFSVAAITFSSQLTSCLHSPPSQVPQSEQSVFLHRHDLMYDPQPLASFRRFSGPECFIYYLPQPFGHHRQRKVPSGINSWCFLS